MASNVLMYKIEPCMQICRNPRIAYNTDHASNLPMKELKGTVK
jgi:hypothetical protein